MPSVLLTKKLQLNCQFELILDVLFHHSLAPVLFAFIRLKLTLVIYCSQQTMNVLSWFQRGTNSFYNPSSVINPFQSYTDQLLSAIVTGVWQSYTLANPQTITFLENPSEDNSVVGSILGLLNPGTPGSDILLGDPTTNLVLWARGGNDTILGVDPGATEPGAGKIDAMLGDSSPGPGSAPGADRFILGDEQKAYYASQSLLDFAVIVDFETFQDKIRLQGRASNYRLISFNSGNPNFQNGTAIFQNKPLPGFLNLRYPELIAIVFADAPLSLAAPYFEYDNTPPSPGVLSTQVKQFGTPGIEFAFGTAADTFGNGFLSGATTGALAGPNQGSYDAWLAKYDGNGNRSWIRQFGTPQQDVATRVTTDALGNSYVTGFTLGNLGGQNAGLEDAFLAKYSPSGDLLWIRQYGTASLDNSLDVAVDRSNNSVYVTGFTIGALGGPNASPIPVTDDSYIAKFDSNGNVVWIRQFGTTAFDEAYSVTTDQQGNVFATGWTQGNLGGTNAGLYDVWLTKYDSAGNRQWIRQFGTPEYDFPWKTVVDGENNVYVTGWTLGRLGSTSFGSYDAFLAKYDNNGNRVWIKQFGTSGDDAAFGLSVDSSNNLFVAGFTDRSFGGANAGQEDAWYAKFDKNGNQLWVKQFGSPDIDRARGGIAVNNQGKIFVGGSTEGVLGGPNAGSFDALLLIDQDTTSTSTARTTATRATQPSRDPVSGIQTGAPLTGSSISQSIQTVKQSMATSRNQVIGTANSFLGATSGFFPSTQTVVNGLLGQSQNVPFGLGINSSIPALSTQPFAANAL
nr:MAG: hypothetical protein EDM05_28300 [Leptolyngbya sp. IPPAS B-1204]